MSKYLKKFATEAEYNTYVNGSPDAPNVSYITENGDVEINKTFGGNEVKVGAYDGAATYNWYNYIVEVDIPEGYTNLNSQRVGGLSSSLTAVKIPSTVTTIADYAFYNCTSLASVTCLATTPPAIGGRHTFRGISSNVKFYVPAESVEAYKTATNWSTYASDIEAIPTE